MKENKTWVVLKGLIVFGLLAAIICLCIVNVRKTDIINEQRSTIETQNENIKNQANRIVDFEKNITKLNNVIVLQKDIARLYCESANSGTELLNKIVHFYKVYYGSTLRDDMPLYPNCEGD